MPITAVLDEQFDMLHILLLFQEVTLTNLHNVQKIYEISESDGNELMNKYGVCLSKST